MLSIFSVEMIFAALTSIIVTLTGYITKTTFFVQTNPVVLFLIFWIMSLCLVTTGLLLTTLAHGNISSGKLFSV